MANIRLIFDSVGQRWEGVILPVDQWTSLDEYNDVLSIAYSQTGALAGFVFDLGSTYATTTAALERIREFFGEVVADRVSSPDDTAIAGTVAPLSSTAIVETAKTAVFPVLGSVNARARDVAIVDDASRGVVKISMRLPWWATFLRPWVTVRRRGRPEVIALGPMRRANGVHTAELHYGLPTPANSLVAEVIRGSRGAWMSALVAAVVTTALLLGGLALREGGAVQSDDSTLAAVDATTVTVGTATTVTTTSIKLESTSVATTIVAPAAATSSSAQKPVTTTAPPSSTTTPNTILPPGGVIFDEPNQYITANDVRANVTISNNRVTAGDSIDVAVRISGVFINPFSRTGIADLTELVNACRSLIGAKTTTPPTPGWTTNVSVSLAGTGVTAGGTTTLVVVGNVARECGNYAIGTTPLTIDVVRLTLYREVPITLRIPRSLKAGTYELVLDSLDFFGFTKTTPITLTVSG